MKRFLFYFAQELLEFRRPEMESISRIFNINVELPKNDENKPFWILQGISEQEARKLTERSVLIRFSAEIWASGNSLKEFHENLRKYQVEEKYKTESFKFRVESFNNHLQHKVKIEKIESVNYLNFVGTIDLKNPENEFVYFEYYELDPGNIPSDEPCEIFMGRFLCEGARDMIKSISLKTRKFIGNTSMDPQMSLLMANQAKCDQNQLMFDPFCGTGSMLIAAAKFGSYVMGSDIDYQMLHALTRPSRIRQKVREADESIRANMDQYSLSHLYLDVFVGDFANCPLIDKIQFDSIITDPPYGIREAMSKLERKDRKKQPSTSTAEDTIHFPSLSAYKIKHLYDDLLTFSFKHLKMGGRLVCFLPCLKETYNENTVPQHSGLKLVANSEQKLQGDAASRRLLTYEKISEEGELVNSLEDIDFRERFFSQMDRNRQKQERSEEIKKHNLEETAKRGITLSNIYEYKQNCNKKRLKEME